MHIRRACLYAFATFGGTGYAPIAPATAASLVFALIWGLAAPVPLAYQISLLLLVTVLGVPASGRMAKRHGKDPRLVVIDEVAGMLVTFLGISAGWSGWLAGFFWFRVFDITKPFPARRFEDLPGGVGIMADDLMAGVYANIALRLTLALTGWGS